MSPCPTSSNNDLLHNYVYTRDEGVSVAAFGNVLNPDRELPIASISAVSSAIASSGRVLTDSHPTLSRAPYSSHSVRAA